MPPKMVWKNRSANKTDRNASTDAQCVALYLYTMHCIMQYRAHSLISALLSFTITYTKARARYFKFFRCIIGS